MERHKNALESNSYLPVTKLSDLINSIVNMTRKPTIESDLSQVLDDFLDKLGECDKYLQNGIFNMNFAEAALLLQDSADLYGKKVDLLWDTIFDYQKRLVLADDGSSNKQELEKLEERKRKYKRKRKQNADDSTATKLIDKFSFGSTDHVDYLSQNYQQSNLVEEWEKFYVNDTCGSSYEQPSTNKSSFLPNNLIYSEDNDYVGRYEQFHSATLIDHIINLLPNDHDCVTQMRVDSYAINDFMHEKSISSDASPATYEKQLQQYVADFVSSRSATKDVSEESLKRSFVCLERLPHNVVSEKLRRASCADSLFDDDRFSSVSANCFSPTNCSAGDSFRHPTPFGQVSSSLENRSKSCSQDSAFYELDEMEEHVVITPAPEAMLEDVAIIEPVVESVETVVETVVENVESVETVVENVETVVESVEAVVESVEAVVETPVVQPTVLPTLMAPPIGSDQLRHIIITRPRLTKRVPLLQPDEEEVPVKKRKISVRPRMSEKALKKLATGVTAHLKNFEQFFRSQYRTSENEGEISSDVSDSESDESDDDSEEPPNVCLDETLLNPTEDGADDELEETIADEPAIPDILHPVSLAIRGLNLNEKTGGDADSQLEEASRRNVRDWRAFILPKLKAMQNKPDFDIHECGWSIIEPSRIGEERRFKSIVGGKGPAEVARFFSATLQLANTNNVEITGSVPGQISNDSFGVKTLDKTRHYELLEDYQAPSEETFRERLERAKALNPKVPLHSTPLRGPTAKKAKLSIHSKKLF